MNILDKLTQLKNKFVGGDNYDVAVIDGWISTAKRLFLLNSLKDNDGIKYVIEIFESEVKRINDQLLKSDSKSLPDYERDRLIDKRELAQKYLNLFNVETELEELEKKVEENID